MTQSQPTEAQLKYVEEFASFMTRTGLAWMPGRVMAWLLVCQPPQQTAAQIADALGASRGAISGAVNLLTTSRLIERVRFRGDRKDYFRIPADAWTVRFRHGVELTRELGQLARRGLSALPDKSEENAYRLNELAEFTEFSEQETVDMLKRWEQQRGRQQ